jgi:ABC-type transport system substrate-binding protein
VPARDMRLHPIGTGPFKFVEFKPNASITLTRNPDYWKPGRPYLDGIEWTIIKDTSTRLLSFIAHQADVYFGVTFPQLQDVKGEVPDAVCDDYLVNGSRNLITVAARNVPPWRDPALILIDQLKEIYIDGELEPVDTTQWYPRLMRKDYKVGLNVTESEVDDPDAQFYENYKCGALRNYSGYCNDSVDELIDRQSREMNADKRRQLVWQIERKLIEEDARPDILYVRGITCRRPYVKDLISMVNSIYNGSRFEDVWFDN